MRGGERAREDVEGGEREKRKGTGTFHLKKSMKKKSPGRTPEGRHHTSASSGPWSVECEHRYLCTGFCMQRYFLPHPFFFFFFSSSLFLKGVIFNLFFIPFSFSFFFPFLLFRASFLQIAETEKIRKKTSAKKERSGSRALCKKGKRGTVTWYFTAGY